VGIRDGLIKSRRQRMKSFLKRFFSSKEYEWYRPEYRRIFNVCLFSLLPLWLIPFGLAYLAQITNSPPDLWLEPLAVSIFAIVLADTTLAGTLKLVDQHEKKLVKGKAKTTHVEK
jgi:hypothetical protein